MDPGQNRGLVPEKASAIRSYVKRRPRLRSWVVRARGVWHRLQFLYLILRKGDERKPAGEAMPALRSFSRGSCSITEEMRAAYEEYTRNISHEGWPLSFESACLLWSLCEATGPKRILDLGSGFSSFIFRLYRSTAKMEPTIWSVDEDSDWLEKTRVFLRSHELPDDNLINWRTLQATEPGSFDLTSLDLADIDERVNIFEKLLNWLTPGGLLLLDDMHNSAYRKEIMRMLGSQNSVEGYSVRWLTLDKTLRYCLLVRRHVESCEG